MADNAALLAEIEVIKESLTTERAAADAALTAAREVISQDFKIIETYKRANGLLQEAVAAKDKKRSTELKVERRKGWQRAIMALLIGGAVGAIAAH